MSLQNLFVAKLPRNISDADLLHIFSEFDPSSAKIMLDAATGKSKGFGFVLFEEEEKGAKAYKALNRKMTRACGHSFTLVIYPSNHNGKIFTEESNALYIRNIPISIGQEKMERFLKTFGNLIYFAMREDHYGNPVWVVYAEYETVDDAKNALAKLHGNNTYFHGSVPILAKFEDSDDAKKERRRRRDGMQTHAPNSGCIFPPPHSHHENSGSLHTASTILSSENIVSNGHGGRSKRTVGSKTSSKSTAGPRRSGTGGIAAAVPLLTPASAPPPPPPFLPAMTDVTQHTPTAAFSMLQQLLPSTPSYCYTLGESGQQVFIPASSFSSSMPPYNFAPATQSAPLLLLNPSMQTTDAVAKQNFSLLNPTANATVVLMENGLHYMLTPDAMNMNCEPFSSPTSAFGPMLAGSQPKSLLGMSSNQATYTNGSACSINSFGTCFDALYTDPLHVVPLRCDAEDDFLGEASIAGPNNEHTAHVHALQSASAEGSAITCQRGLGVGW